MKYMRHLTAKTAALASAAMLFLAGCGGGGLLADGGIIGTGTIVGTVPGTVIEAYGANGDYVETFSEFNTTGRHPFRLRLKAGVGYYLVMIINEGTENEIVMPIAFPDSQGEVFARITLKEGQEIDLGYVALYMNCAEVPVESDPDDDCVLDKPFLLNEAGADGPKNPLKQMDADDDGWNDYDDDDHGYGQHNGQQYQDPQDLDNDRVPNKYDDDFKPGPNDEDEDGIDDDADENPGNIPEDDDGNQTQWNGQGMHPTGLAWREQHGGYAEHNLDSCGVCHGDDFRGTPASAQVGCYDCHDGPNTDDGDNPGNVPDEDDNDNGSQAQWNGQGMHPTGSAWREQHGDYAEHNLESCGVCHGDDFRGTPASAQVGCYDCHDGPSAEND